MIKEYLIEKAEENDPCLRCAYGDFKKFICLHDGEVVGDGYRCAHFKPSNEEPENIAESCGIPCGQAKRISPWARVEPFADEIIEGWIHDALEEKLGREPTSEEVETVAANLPELVTRRTIEELVANT